MKIKINLLKKSKLRAALFIAASFMALGLLPIFLLSLNSILEENGGSLKINPAPLSSEGRTFQDEPAKEYDTSDPFITKVPRLKDMITKPIVNGDDPAIGNQNAPVTIVEFSDFECEFCQKQEKILKQTLENFGDRVKLIWKDYPESELPSLSFQAAVAARCAGEQNEFWPYHDLLFYNSGNLSKEIFIDLAKKLKLKSDEFKGCLNDDNTKNLIQNNIKEADALNITGVPFIYVNDKEIMGEVGYEELRNIIEIELKNITNNP